MKNSLPPWFEKGEHLHLFSICLIKSVILVKIENLLLKSIYLLGCDSFKQILQQVWAVGWGHRTFDALRVSEPANEETQDKKPHCSQEVPGRECGRGQL